MVIDLKSYMKDTGDVLRHISQISVQGELLLVGIDVESLYTSIPHDWGIRAVEIFLDRHFPNHGPQNEFLVDLLTFALKNNFFQFLSKNYQQINGTSMGAPWAPAYACLHLGLWEEDMVYTSPMYLSHVHT